MIRVTGKFPDVTGISGAVTTLSRRPLLLGGLNRSSQHFILEGKDGVWDGTEISSRFYCGGEDGVMGSTGQMKEACN